MTARDIWVGSAYAKGNPKVLILGESVYGDGPPLREYVPMWFEGQRDQTFTRIFNAFSGSSAASATKEQRKAFWDKIVFYNFLIESVGPTRSHRPTEVQLQAAQVPLQKVLREYLPDGVLILGKTHADHAKPIITELHINCISCKHPTGFGVPTAHLMRAWNELHDLIARNG